MSVLISGSIALDHVKTPHDEHDNLLGGSASYAAIAASFFSPVNLVGIVGHDFPQEHIDLFKDRSVDLGGVEFSEGGTFRWSGEYFDDMNTRETLDVALNVLEAWQPSIPETFRSSRIVLLANAHPENQHSVLDQVGEGPVFTIADTMDLWITIARERLLELLKRVDLLVINDSEAKQLMETTNLIAAGKRLCEMGPSYVIIKKGEHGALLFGNHRFFSCGAYPLNQVYDPTGAGDSFVGSLAGYLASLGKDEFSFEDLSNAVARGTIIAGYTCESFSTHRLEKLSNDEFETRLAE
ncbi:MAG: bifunctional hydroxymethylpyrimidine kinase/phosphomethylpyrimidine kinase, partial [Verrucomicrobiae bacterium]|nr:bifunctional hydroxymethylpyrimidine kinase/phosphomethylpyrimidine kinase [Verrucomicrobiae bacterium]